MPNNPSYTLNEFCAAEKISRGLLYKLWKRGEGPRFFMAGSHRRITGEARADWHKEREAAAKNGGTL